MRTDSLLAIGLIACGSILLLIAAYSLSRAWRKAKATTKAAEEASNSASALIIKAKLQEYYERLGELRLRRPEQTAAEDDLVAYRIEVQLVLNELETWVTDNIGPEVVDRLHQSANGNADYRIQARLDAVRDNLVRMITEYDAKRRPPD